MTSYEKSRWIRVNQHNMRKHPRCDSLKRPGYECKHEFRMGERFYRTSTGRALCEVCWKRMENSQP